MENNKKQEKEFEYKLQKLYNEYFRFSNNTLKKLEVMTEFFEAITQKIPTSRKTSPELIEKYFRHSLLICAEEVSIQGNYMKEAYNECMKYRKYFDEHKLKSLSEYEEIKNRANEFIDKVRNYYKDYQAGKIPLPKITYTR